MNSSASPLKWSDPRLLVAFASTILASPAVAQVPTPEPGDLPMVSEVVEVRVVNIEVVVTDRRGARVAELGVEDFRLQVDGEATPIEYFTEVVGGHATLEASVAGTVASQAVPAVAPGSPVPTSYLIFIDDFFALTRDRNRVLDALVEKLPLLHPEDRMAMVAYDGKKLDMLMTWSQSTAALEKAIRQAQGRKTYGLNRALERNNFESRRQLFRDVGGEFASRGNRLDGEEWEYAQLVAGQLRQVVSGATSTLRSFGSPPGRKVMMLLAGGWPYRPVEYVVNDLERLVVSTFLPRGDQLYEPLVNAANLLGYTLYPVDLPGFQGSGDLFGGPTPSQASNSLSSLRESQLHDSLAYLADETGGKALLNALRTEAFEQVASDTRSYYWLGFTPIWRGDDEEHEIDVEVEGRGLRVRFRSGYQDLSRQREVSMAVESSLLFGDPPTSQPLYASFGVPVKAGGRKVVVPLSVGIPLDSITLIPTGEGHVARLELRMAVLDDDGGRSEIPIIAIDVATEGEPRPGQMGLYETRIRLRRKPSRLVLAVHDTASGVILSTTVEFVP